MLQNQDHDKKKQHVVDLSFLFLGQILLFLELLQDLC